MRESNYIIRVIRGGKNMEKMKKIALVLAVIIITVKLVNGSKIE